MDADNSNLSKFLTLFLFNLTNAWPILGQKLSPSSNAEVIVYTDQPTVHTSKHKDKEENNADKIKKKE